MLAVTAKDAAAMAEKVEGVEYHVCGFQVAALLPASLVEKELKSRKDLQGFSKVILPGGVRLDVRALEKALGVPCFKGPTHISDLRWMVEEKLGLSKDEPVEKLHERRVAEKALAELAEIRQTTWGRLAFGGMISVVAEIADAPLLKDEELAARAAYYAREGAGVIDLGMIAGRDNSEEVERMVEAARKASGLAVSVDSMNERELLAAADARADLLLSLAADKTDLASSLGIPCVVVPVKSGRVEKDAWKKVVLLEDACAKLKNDGIERFIADPILDPVNFGFAESMQAYYNFRKRNHDVPMLLGTGNVVELFDAESIGMNALLAGFASELEIQFVLTPENSQKARGSVRELAQAARLLFVSKKRKGLAKDVGIGVFGLKEKKLLPQAKLQADESVNAGKQKEKLDESFFKIFLDDSIGAVYEEKGKRILFKGKTARDAGIAIANDRRVHMTAEHAVYLGRELAKAELCLLLGKSYVQDKPLDWGVYGAEEVG